MSLGSGGGPRGPGEKPLVRIVESDGEVVELAADTSAGPITVIANMFREGDELLLDKLHMDGPGPGSLGYRELKALVVDLAGQLGASVVYVQGARRTTGANPGHVPELMKFRVGDRR